MLLCLEKCEPALAIGAIWLYDEEIISAMSGAVVHSPHADTLIEAPYTEDDFPTLIGPSSFTGEPLRLKDVTNTMTFVVIAIELPYYAFVTNVYI